ncbi:MAG: DNA polymerase Y family protein [Deltaproteobacteria bacterium]|nr:DNA polymerase Y family protein [Deltaproteobacteria bacterium]MBW2696038.1 DNA polymerase Y family protein [Deltaproteobacteria bacterium]
MPPRIACLLVPDLPLQAELRAHPALRGEPLVVASGADARADVVALSPESAAAGVRVHHSIAQARTACPQVRVRVASPVLEQTTRETLLDVALSLSPRAALAPRATGFFTAEGCVFVDASGVGALFHSEHGFASALAARAEAHGLPGFVALAGSQTVSRWVARRMTGGPNTALVIPIGGEANFLAPLPLDLLDPDDRLAQTLTRFGVKTVRDLLHLPRRASARRMGPELLDLVARARGEAPEPPLPEPAAARIEEAIDLEAPVDQLEPLGFVLRGLLSRLAERLALRGLACAALDVELVLEGGARDARRIGLAAPTLDIRVLLRLVNLALADHPPDAPVERVGIGTEGAPRRRDQLDLFRPHGPDPAALGQTLLELESLCGEGRVGAPEVRDTHHPTAFGMRPFAPSESPLTRETPCAGNASSAPEHACLQDAAPPTLPAIRALRPPVRAEVQLRAGRPSFIRSAVTHGDVLETAGPWRTTGYWWSREERFAFDHFDVQMSDGLVVRLCFDWMNRVWQIDGIYD